MSITDIGTRQIVALQGKLEMDIAQLPPDEMKMFLEEYGIEEPSLNRMIRLSYDLLGLESFFTVGPDEVRAFLGYLKHGHEEDGGRWDIGDTRPACLAAPRPSTVSVQLSGGFSSETVSFPENDPDTGPMRTLITPLYSLSLTLSNFCVPGRALASTLGS